MSCKLRQVDQHTATRRDSTLFVYSLVTVLKQWFKQVGISPMLENNASESLLQLVSSMSNIGEETFPAFADCARNSRDLAALLVVWTVADSHVHWLEGCRRGDEKVD